MPCREAQRRDIERVVRDALTRRGGVGGGAGGGGNSLYISGVPGTGKTATVKEVMRSFRERAVRRELAPFFYVEVNGLRLQSPQHAYVAILEALTGERTSPVRALAGLEARFSAPPVQGRATVLFLDEMDTLTTPPLHGVLYNIFEWASRREAHLLVVGVANTLDLPDRMPPRIKSRMAAHRIPFSPYKNVELQAIAASRLEAAGEDVAALFCDAPAAAGGKPRHDALKYLAAKVAASSGDARRMLELARRATELAEERWRSAGGAHRRAVAMEDATAAVRETFDSPHMTFIRCGAMHEKIFMAALCLERRASGVDVVALGAIMARHGMLCKAHALETPHFSALLDIAVRWGSCRVTVAEPARRGVLMKVYLNCSDADVWHALEDDEELPWLAAYGPEAAAPTVRPMPLVTAAAAAAPPRALATLDTNAAAADKQ
jgi:origin recognition complex subunit 1